jgi:NADPH-dependent 2,4-dienoyl-CoA reductase/sulfur reductase-like enzyme
MTEKLVIIGGDAAGMSAASLAKRRQPSLEIETYEMGDYTSYGACGMPYYISGQFDNLADLVVVTPEEFRSKRGINVFTRHRVETIRPDRKTIEVYDMNNNSRREVSYDKLLIATGAEPIVPKGLDTDLPGVFTLRGLPDAEGIKNYAREHSCRTGLVIGTGYIGMEMAEALSESGLETTILGRRPRVMGTFEPEISQNVAEILANHHVPVLFGAEPAGIAQTPDGSLKLSRTNGESLEADLIVIGTGVKPRSDLAMAAGLELGSKQAIKVDRFQQTSYPDIWSAGDCAEAYHVLLKKNAYIPLALTANRAGRIAGLNIIGERAEFPGILGSAVCKVFELEVARTGLGYEEARAEGLEVVKVVVTSRSRPHYYPGSAQITTILIVGKDTEKLWGAQMVGTDGVAHRINSFATALASGLTLEEIHSIDMAYAPPFSPVWDPVLIACEVAMKEVRKKG